MDDNNGCGCYLILMGIGLLGWIVSGISEDNSGRMTRGQVFVTPREFNENPIPKCARVPRFWEGFNWGSPTARHLN